MDELFLDRIVNVLFFLNLLKLVEIGVGLGDLIFKLLDCYFLKIYEIDSYLCEKM